MPIADLGDISLHYRDSGSGPPVLGIMGFSLDQRMWAGQVPAVTERNRFITFDNRGVGGSTGPVVATIDQMAEDALRLLDHLAIDKTVVFGVSMGGAIAQRFALDNPDRVSALILAVTWARPIEFMRRQDATASDVARVLGTRALLDIGLLRMFTPAFFEMGQAALDRMVAALTGPDAPPLPTAEVLLAQLEAIGKHDTLADLPRISCPTFVVGGRFDVTVPCFASEEIAAAIPGAELAIFDTGHGLMLEEMGRFNARLRSFLDSLERASSPGS
jgi:pimeloyl-ACP methyl ester carboxylesterase